MPPCVVALSRRHDATGQCSVRTSENAVKRKSNFAEYPFHALRWIEGRSKLLPMASPTSVQVPRMPKFSERKNMIATPTAKPASAPLVAPLSSREGTDTPPCRKSTKPNAHPPTRPIGPENGEYGVPPVLRTTTNPNNRFGTASNPSKAHATNVTMASLPPTLEPPRFMARQFTVNR